MNNLRIVLLEDSVDDAALVERTLLKEGIGYTTRLVETRRDYKSALEDFQPDVVISDHTLPQFDSLEALKMFHEYKERQNPLAVFILVTGTVSEEFAVQIMKKGADDYILKDRLQRLPTAIISALEKNRILEEKRKAEEEKLHFLGILQKSMNELFLFCSDTLLFKYANQAGLQNLGYSFEEIVQLTPLDIAENGTEEAFREFLKEIAASGKGKIFETIRFRKDGTRYPAQIHLQLIEEQGDRDVFMANVLDITELKKEEQQKKLALFIQNTFNENRDLEGSLRIILEEICKLQGIPAGEIWVRQFEGRGISKYAHWSLENDSPKEAGKVLSHKALEKRGKIYCEDIKEVIAEKQPGIVQEVPYTSAISYPIWLGSEIKAIFVFYFSEGVRDKENFVQLSDMVQDQLANNIKRKKQEIELSKIFDLSPEVLCVAGLDGFVKKINQSFYTILGYSKGDFEAIEIPKLIHPEDIYTLDEWKNATLEKQEVVHLINRIRAKDGAYKWFSWSSTPFMEEGLTLLVGKDITEHKKYLEAIEKQNKKLAEIAWEQSHVVRGPLARMLGCIEHMEDSDDHFDELLENVKSSAYELDRIIKTIVEKSELIKNM